MKKLSLSLSLPLVAQSGQNSLNARRITVSFSLSLHAGT